ncbi:MAG: c-type cytochrome [Verrucomicrobia bacterium]|nr:c-type cytochrome [Verrucomicrobiota bacterium]
MRTKLLQISVAACAALWQTSTTPLLAEPVSLHTRTRARSTADTNRWEITEKQVHWEPTRTAVVVCDMWDKHHCPDATERVGEMAPRMNEVLKAARSRGIFIIHCPSDTMGFYKDHPGRKLAQSAPKVETKVPLQGWCSLDGVKEPALPIDDSDGGCDGCPECPGYGAWKRQHPALEIMDGDAITDSAEALYLMRQRGITNVIVMGVHINMCVLGRSFAIRQMVAQGQSVVLMRDMTDSMYNHHMRPYVSHFRGTELVVDHIEQYWCPSITSVDFLGGSPFRFQGDVTKRIVLIIGENEYSTSETLPDFARKELEWRGYRISTVMAPAREGDPNFQNYESIRDADLVVVSTRRRTPPKAMMELMRAHVAAGKPVIGLRTASHGFQATPPGPGFEAWNSFDVDVLGGQYAGHYNNKPPAAPHSLIEIVRSNAAHLVLTGVKPAPLRVTSHLYKNRNLAPGTTALLQGRVEGQDTVEPVAWVNAGSDRRTFYTSLGNPEDFKLATFRRMLLNSILWCLHDPVPPPAYEMTGTTSSLPTPAPTPRPPAPAPAPAPAAASASTPAPAAPQTPSLDLPQETQAPALSASESMSRFQIAEDLEWDQLLTEPRISQPVFLNFDERGRMWLVEFRQYPAPAGLKMVSRDSVWRAVYDRVPPPPPHHFKGADRITIHEDSDGDGAFDRHKTFLDGLNIVTAVERGRGGVWVLNPPYLLFYPDANNDDVPDGDPEVRLSGFGLEDTHSVANSLRWGPDGWLYAAQGSTVTANILVARPDGKPTNTTPIYSQGQNIWRYHPEKRIYEVFAEGGGNAFGCEIDSQGRVFSGHNGGDTRGFHYVQGGYLQKGFEKHGPLSNPYAYGYFPSMAHGSEPRFTHNFIIYDHGSLPSRYAGRLFGVEPIQGRIVQSELLADRSTFRTRDVSRPVTSADRWFRPVDIKVGPDGAIYICDWYDQQVNHYRNHEGKMDTDRGRVYRLKSKGASPQRSENLSGLSSVQLTERLKHPNRWVRQTALRLLGDKRDASVLPTLTSQLARSTGQLALETLWALNLSGGFTEAEALRALDHSDPFVRLWTARLIGDGRKVSAEAARKLAALAGTEPNLEVRNQLAATAKRLPAQQGLAIIQSLAGRTEDVSDNRMPLLVWWAVEVHCDKHRDAVVRLFEEPSFWRNPMVETHLLDRIARRFAQAGSQRDLEVCARLFELSPSVEHSRRLMSGFEAAFKGRTLTGLPDPLVRAMGRHGVGSAAFGLRRGDEKTFAKAIRVVADATATRAERMEFLSIMSEVKVPGALPALTRAYRGVYKDDALRKAVLSTFQTYDDPGVADIILSAYAALGRESQPTALTLLASRPPWALKLVQSLRAEGTSWSGFGIKPETIPPNIVRKLKQHRHSELSALMEKHWPNKGTPTTAEMEEKIRQFATTVRGGTGDPYLGRTLFQNLCGNCHRLFGQGADAGPDLTVFDRTDLESMLLAMVNPSAEIREGFENYSVETKDGRSLAGFLVEQDDRMIVLRGLDNQNVTLARNDLESLSVSGMSLMPEGLLDSLNPDQTRALFAYLRSTQPLVGEPPRPAPKP